MINDLTEAITHAKEKAKELNDTADNWKRLSDEKGLALPSDYEPCKECAAEHDQLATWLTELEERREADRWISVKDKLPDDLEPVNITWINHESEPYYKEIKDKPFTATGVYFNGQWYWWSTLCADILAEYSHNYDDIIDKAIEITHWKPLPKPYESEAEK